MSQQERQYEFTDDFQRKILALAIRSDLLVRAPDAFSAEFFGGSRLQSPRYRLGRIVQEFAKENRDERPGAATMDELVRRECLRLKPEERAVFEEEWKLVRAIEVPDVGFVLQEVRAWAKDAALSVALLRSAELLEAARRTGRQGQLTDIRGIVDEALQVGEPEDAGGVPYLGQDHTGIWIEDYRRTKVPTGWGRLDLALDGGPQRGEVFYFLAPPKGAKSTGLLNIALNASRIRKGVAFFSYEMRKEPLIRRMDRNVARATKHELRQAPERLQHAMAGMKAMAAGEIWVQEFLAKKQGVEEAARIIERRRGMGHEIEVAVFDFLNIMSPRQREKERRLELPAISRELAALAHELDLVVWTAAQVNRQAVNKERIKKTDIAEAFEVIAVAHGVIAICGPETLKQHKQRRLFLAALRDEEDERDAGLYYVDMDRMVFREIKDIAQPPEGGGDGTATSPGG